MEAGEEICISNGDVKSSTPVAVDDEATVMRSKPKPPKLLLIEPAADDEDVDTVDMTVDSPTTARGARRLSRLEEILEIPSVAAALVHDEGYQLMKLNSRRNSRDRPKSPIPPPVLATPDSTTSIDNSPATPSRFDFEHDALERVTRADAAAGESEYNSDTASQSSSSQSLLFDAVQDRPHVALLHAEPSPLAVSDVLDSIANVRRASDAMVTAEAALTLAAADKRSTPIPDVEAVAPTVKSLPPSGVVKQGSRYRKFRRKKPSSVATQVQRTPSAISLIGWESLSRALARVGNETFLSDAEQREQSWRRTVVPILKARPAPAPLFGSVNSGEPGARGSATMNKKTVSFGRLPSEASVKNSADCVELMRAGHQFVKMRSSSRVYNRLYWFDELRNCLRWEPSKKDAGKAIIEIASIREVRPGKTTDLFLTSDISAHFPDDCSFSIIHSEETSLDLIANSPDDANVWVTGLRCLMSMMTSGGNHYTDGLQLTDPRDSWLGSMFDAADANRDGFLDAQESLELLTTLSDGGIRELRIKQKLTEYLQMKDTDKSRLTRSEFVEIFKDVATRPEIYFLLARYASKNDQLTRVDLQIFLESEQGLETTPERCLEIIEAYEPSDEARAKHALGIDGFTKYLMSDECAIFDPRHVQVCQDMTQPLTHYFIASSHNTYLMEDQVAGPSNVNAYVRALLRCCRCVELDCWDGEDGTPVVTHGHTRTNSVAFRQVVEAIGAAAFRNSQYPVLLVIENHCGEQQQVQMASDLKQVLGQRLYLEQPDDSASSFPSPEQLKNRFLICSKKLPLDADVDADYVSDDDEGRETSAAQSMSPFEDVPGSPQSFVQHQPSRGTELAHPSRRQLLTRQLSDLISCCIDVHLRDDLLSDFARLHDHRSHVCSIHEDEALNCISKFPDQLCHFTKNYLTRVYPSGFRLDSTNFNPQDMWNYGVQIASLNYQTPGLMMDINDGRFSMNGGCGFVLKPSIMRDKLAYFNPQGVQPGLVGKSLHLRIISGQNFPKPRGGGAKGHVIDPYVLIELFGVSSDCGEERTRTAPNNSGASPLFDESFEFRLGVPALALVRFVVLDDDFIGDEFIGQYTIPFECLQPGYRHVYLRSIFDEPLDDATLFIHVAISDAETSPFAVATPSSASSTPQARTLPPQAQSKRQVSAPPKRARKQRSRKELHQQLHLRHVGLQPLDGTFAPLSSHLHELAVLRDAQRTSMALFREACGQPSLASIKQCVRAIRLRSLADVAAETARPAHPRRKFSSATDLDAGADASSGQRGGSRGTLKRAASADYTGTTCAQAAGGTRRQMSESTTMAADVVQVARGSGGLQLELRGCCAVSESWRRTQLAFERMVGDLTRTVDSTTRLLDVLLAAHRRAHQLYEDFTPYFSGDGAETPPRLQGGGDSNGDVKYNKQSKAKKKPSSVPGGDVEIERRRRLVAEENVRWNCSVVRGAADMTRALERDARQALNDVWDGAVLCDISSHQASRVGTNPTTIVESVAENNANNNNDSATVEGRGQVSSRRGSTSSGSSCGLTTAPTNPDHLASLPTTTL